MRDLAKIDFYDSWDFNWLYVNTSIKYNGGPYVGWPLFKGFLFARILLIIILQIKALTRGRLLKKRVNKAGLRLSSSERPVCRVSLWIDLGVWIAGSFLSY